MLDSNEYRVMNQLLREQIRSMGEELGEGNLIDQEVLVEGNQYQINKVLVDKLVALKTQLLKEKRQNHAHNLQNLTLAADNQKLLTENKMNVELIKQTKLAEATKHNSFANRIRNSLEITLDSGAEQIHQEIQRIKSINIKLSASRTDNRPSKLRKEVSDLILQNFKTNRLLMKTDSCIEALNNPAKQWYPPVQHLPVADSVRNGPQLSIRVQVNEYIIPSIAPAILKSKSLAKQQSKGESRADQLHESLKYIDKLKFQIEEIKKQSKVLKERYGSRECLISEKQIQVVTLQQTVNFLREELKRNDQKIYALQQQVETKDQRILQLTETNQEQVKEGERSQRRLKEVEDELLSVSERVREFQEVMARGQEDQSNRKKQESEKLALVGRQLEESLTKIAKQQKSIKFLQDRLLESRGQKQRYAKQIEEERVKSRGESESVREIRESHQRVINELSQVREQLMRVQGEKRDQTEILRNDNECMKKQFGIKSEELERLKLCLQEIQSRSHQHKETNTEATPEYIVRRHSDNEPKEIDVEERHEQQHQPIVDSTLLVKSSVPPLQTIPQGGQEQQQGVEERLQPKEQEQNSHQQALDVQQNQQAQNGQIQQPQTIVSSDQQEHLDQRQQEIGQQVNNQQIQQVSEPEPVDMIPEAQYQPSLHTQGERETQESAGEIVEIKEAGERQDEAPSKKNSKSLLMNLMEDMLTE